MAPWATLSASLAFMPSSILLRKNERKGGVLELRDISLEGVIITDDGRTSALPSTKSSLALFRGLISRSSDDLSTGAACCLGGARDCCTCAVAGAPAPRELRLAA